MAATKSSRIKGGSDTHESEEESFDDVVLVTDGRKIHTSSSLLAYNSKIFASLLKQQGSGPSPDQQGDRKEGRGRSNRTPKDDDPDEVTPRTPSRPYEIDMTHKRYKDVKLLLSFLQPKESRGDLKGETAIRLLPIATEYKMTRLKRNCGLALIESFLSMRGKNESGTVGNSECLRYLAMSEKYGFDRLKKLCIEECAAKSDVVARKEMLEDKHISSDVKLVIMDKMCDSRNDLLERRLKQIQHTMELRCTEIERRRKEYAQVTEQWKAELRQEVDDLEKRIERDHRKLLDDLKEKKLADDIYEQIATVNDTLVKDIKNLESVTKMYLDGVKEKEEDTVGRLELIYEKMMDKTDDMETDKANKAEIKRSLKVIREGTWESVAGIRDARTGITNYMDGLCTKIKIYMEKIDDSLWGRLLKCQRLKDLKSSTSSYTLQEEVDRLTAEMAIKVQSITEIEVRNECARLEQERTKAQLHKYKKRNSALNTWIKWATPLDDEDETKCLCYRHVTPRN